MMAAFEPTFQVSLEQTKGIEPSEPAWKAGMLPLHHVCIELAPTNLPVLLGVYEQKGATWICTTRRTNLAPEWAPCLKPQHGTTGNATEQIRRHNYFILLPTLFYQRKKEVAISRLEPSVRVALTNLLSIDGTYRPKAAYDEWRVGVMWNYATNRENKRLYHSKIRGWQDPFSKLLLLKRESSLQQRQRIELCDYDSRQQDRYTSVLLVLL